MGDSESGTGTTPVIGRVVVGICAAAALIIVGMFIADALSTSPTAVLSGTAQSGPFELLAIGLHFSVILGLIFAGNSLTRPDPDYGKVLNLFRRNDTSGFNEAAPALPLLSCSFLAYWLGFGGVLLFVWLRHEAAPGIGELSASLGLLGAAGLALWMILVALGKRSRHGPESGAPEHKAALSANTLRRPGTRGPTEPYRSHVGIEYRTIRATIPLVELSATSEELHFRFRFGLGLIFRPWHFRREQVFEVFTTRGLLSTRIHIRGEGFEVYVYASPPEPLLLTLEELGYPVDWIMRR